MEKQPTVVFTSGDVVAVLQLQSTLQGRGWNLVTALNSAEAHRLLLDESVDLLLVDRSVELHNVLELAAAAKARSDLPVIFVSDTRSGSAVVRVLGGGTDDVIAAPITIEALADRIEAQLRMRRREPAHDPGISGTVARSGLVELDLVREIASIGSRTAQLSSAEARLLHLFLQNAGRVLTPAYIGQMAGPGDFPGGYEDVHRGVLELQRRLESLAEDAKFFVVVNGAGYIFTGGAYDSRSRSESHRQAGPRWPA